MKKLILAAAGLLLMTTAAAAPSRYPPMKICSVSGLEGKYFDRARKARYASAKEYRTLQDIPTAALKAHKGQI